MKRDAACSDDDGSVLLSDINVTPLVDVGLVLLIVFMISAPMMKVGMDVRLPRTTSSPELAGERIVVSIDKNRKLYLNNEEVTLAHFERYLHNALVLRSPEVYLRADRDVSYGYVARVLDMMRRAGAVDVGLVTVPEGKGEKD